MTTKEQALRILSDAKREVQELIDAGEDEALSRLADQLAPYAAIVAKAEGHNDMTLVLERELEL